MKRTLLGSNSSVRRWILGFSAPLLLGSGCITVNLYFPEADLKEAAAEIVNDVRPDDVTMPPPDADPSGASNGSSAPAPAAEKEANDKKVLRWDGSPRKWSFALFDTRVAYAAGAQDKKAEDKKASEKKAPEKKSIKLEVKTPVIEKILETLKKRYPKLLPFYEKGALGEGKDGYLALREAEKLSLKEKRDLQLYLDEENKDRKNLYTELARENKIESSEIPRIGVLFSEEWQKKSKAGWWIEMEKGKWEKKPKEKKS